MDEEKKSLAQNEPVSLAEAPEEANKAEAPQEGGMSTEAAQEPTSAPTEVVNEGQKPAETEKPVKSVKKSRKGLVVGVIVALVLVIGAGVAVVVWKLLATETFEPFDPKAAECGTPVPGEALLYEYSSDNIPQEYRDLYENLYIVPTLFADGDPSGSLGNLDRVESGLVDFGGYDIGWNKKISDLTLMTRFSVLAQPVQCQGLLDHEKDESNGGARCYKAEDISEFIKKYFGRDVDWENFNEAVANASDDPFLSNWRYAPEYGLVIAGHCDYCGVNGPAPYHKRMLVGVQVYGDEPAIVKNNTSIKLIEKVVYVVQVPEVAYYHVPRNFSPEALAEWVADPANKLDIALGADVNDYLDLLDTFKWTIEDKGDGRYKFDSMVKVVK